VPEEVAERVWSQIQGFSGFGFPKAHSVAFGLLAYQSAWLREHYAPEFLASLLNEQPMGFYPPDSLAREAQRRGVRLAGPDVNRSAVLCAVERVRGGPVVRIGLAYVKGVRKEEMAELVAEREGGPYRAIGELASRSGASREGLERLAWAGALDDLDAERQAEGNRRRERWWRIGVAGEARGAGQGRQLPLPVDPPAAPQLSPLGRWERIVEDYRATGINLGEHPLALLREDLGESVARSTDLERIDDGAAVEVAGMVVTRQRPETAKGITFMLLEDERGTVNLVVRATAYERHRNLVNSAPLVRARGKLERREGTINVLVAELAALEWEERPEAKVSRVDAAVERRATRQRAVAELRAVAPAGHSFGRRGR
jgi:error-prone DNA polymerase